ncbi:MAG: FimB/Mfa2 family fimbrial subunit [Bacteroidales bacterium]|nr:FimB/Mfa2 family fimbrial subunit [Bacteroidales bacterium]
MHPIRFAISLAAVGALLSGCDNAIYDYDPDCLEGLELKFVYDYNMEWADAFPAKVHCLTVLVYDQEGTLVERRTEASEVLQDPNYRMTIDLPEGSYHIAAYGGMECDDATFAFDQDLSSTLNSERTVSLRSPKRSPEGLLYADYLLHDHFHGMIDVDVAEADLQYTTATVEMMKNTNNFRIILQQVDGSPLNSADFDITITDDNIRFAHDNSLIANDEAITYQPWSKGQTAVGTNDAGEDWMVAHYDLSTSRLIQRTSRAGADPGTSSVDSPQLKITKADTGETIADLPIINYLLLMKGDHYTSLGNQEFLDRQSEWNVTLFLDKNLSWINAYIVVNDWVVRINDIDQ